MDSNWLLTTFSKPSEKFSKSKKKPGPLKDHAVPKTVEMKLRKSDVLKNEIYYLSELTCPLQRRFFKRLIINFRIFSKDCTINTLMTDLSFLYIFQVISGFQIGKTNSFTPIYQSVFLSSFYPTKFALFFYQC